MKAKVISIVTPCYNEESNVVELCARIADVLNKTKYDYEHILIDNASTDKTVKILRDLARLDKHIKIIVNARNFGHIRSPFYALMQCTGDAVILLAADLQDPPEMIPKFIEKWESGFKTVMAVKPESEESKFMAFIRRSYYNFLAAISDAPLVKNATGAGLFDKKVIELLRKIDDPNPYFRGLLSEIGFPIAVVPFLQPRRQRGISSNNFYSLYDLAMLGITNHSKVPLRLMTIGGFLISVISLSISIVYLIAKLVLWDSFQVGIAPMIIGIFFFGALQIFFIGMLGEYIGSIHTKVRNMPLVIEAERINFDN
jgi:glycosyltransferase involved in cell wall biosynthesis